jgi:Family of unknown function (DUF5675)
MKTVDLARYLFGPFGTFGRLAVVDEARELAACWTLEPPMFPWAPSNARDIACIPVGTYRIERGVFHRNTPTPDDDYPCLVIPDGEVPDRGPGVKIHAGNTLAHTLGCPLVGESIGYQHGAPAVFSSRDALARILEAFGTGPGQLRVREARP